MSVTTGAIKASDHIALVGAINPQSATGAIASSYILVKNGYKYLAIVSVGSTNQTVDASITQASDGSGTGDKAVTGKSITQLSGNDDNKQSLINFSAADLDYANTTTPFIYFRLNVTAGGSAALVSAVILAIREADIPASTVNATTVAEVVV